ncbi:MAG: hypothetical protein N3B21_09605 [Clostridia bacterium]|nr:hypothetical protein [Clostridia bacterium]
MEFKFLFIPVVWILAIVLSMCLLRVLDQKKLDFDYMVNHELPILITICLFAPVTLGILFLGMVVKTGIAVANRILFSKRISCVECSHRCDNQCLFLKLTVRPKMLCNGKFFNTL